MCRIKLCLTLLAFFCLSAISCRQSDLSPETVRIAKERGDVVVAALERYRDWNGLYPAKLTDLVPEYLVELPNSGLGTGEWSYSNHVNGDKFALWTPGDPYISYHSWAADDGWVFVEDL